jgi:Protein of unknown function (DUF3800)
VPEQAVTVICCDESGNDGENLMAGTTTVFAHGSVNIGADEATEIIATLRAETGSRSSEFKTKNLLAPKNLSIVLDLFGSGGPLMDRANVVLAEKYYFVVGKVIDLLVEELAYANGVDLYTGGKARRLAYRFYRDGPKAFPAADWSDLLISFNSLMRMTQNNGAKTTVDEFFSTVDRLRLKGTKKTVEGVLDLVWKSRDHAEEFQQNITEGTGYRALEPLIPTIAQTARTWHEKLKTPIRMVHDEQNTLTPAAVAQIVRELNEVPLEFRRYGIKPVPLTGIVLGDSSKDPRIQVADLVAGFGRAVATAALKGSASDEMLAALRPYVDADSLWGDGASWKQLTNRELPD